MKLADITVNARHEKIMLALNGILRQLDTPVTTGELVRRITEFLGAAEGMNYVAKEMQKAVAKAGGHPLRKPTGETFVKYGRTMPRYEWLPDQSKTIPTGPAEPATVKPMTEREWRVYRVAELEAGRRDPGAWVDPEAGIDAWTVEPVAPSPVEEPAGDFLED